MARMVKRLSNLDIDEISLVDRPANQHGLVAIAKRDEESTMSAQTLFDVAGNEVDASDLEDGQYVYDEDGNEFVNVIDDEDDDDDYEDNEFGKASTALPRQPGRLRAGWNSAREGARRRGDQASQQATLFGATRLGGDRAFQAGARNTRAGQEAMSWGGRGTGGRTEYVRGAGQRSLGGLQSSYGRHPISYVAGGSATAAGGAEYGRRRHNRSKVGKSYGQSVLEELSKSYSDDDRDGVISKALDEMAGENQFLISKAAQLEEQMYALQEEQEFGEFVELAKSYGYAPGDDEEVAEMLYSVAKNDPDYLPVLDRILTSQSEIAKAYTEELGYNGMGVESDALASVYGLADQVISKAAGEISQEQAVTEIFAANPALYDEYELDNRF